MYKNTNIKTFSEEEFSRATYHIRGSYQEKIKDLAYWNRKDIREIIDEIFKEYFSKYKVSTRAKQM